MKTCVVYGLYSLRDSVVRYIGQTTQPMKKRFSQHLLYSKNKKTAVQKWINKSICEGFDVRYTILDGNAVFNDTEVEVIASYKEAGIRLLNHTDGGGGVLGLSQTDETRKKRSESVRRNWETQSVRVRWVANKEQHMRQIEGCKKRTSKPMLGKNHSDETRKKMRDWLASEEGKKLKARRIPRKFTDQQKAELSALKKAWWASKREAQHV